MGVEGLLSTVEMEHLSDADLLETTVVGPSLWASPYAVAVLLCLGSILILRILSRNNSSSKSKKVETVRLNGVAPKTQTKLNGVKKTAHAVDGQETEEAKEEEEKQRRISVFFATQTGTAERFSNDLARELRQRYGSVTAVEVIDIDEYGQDEEELESKMSREGLSFFLAATYGDGEPTDNAARFYKWLTEKSSSIGDDDTVGEEEGKKLLRKMTYGVFGLGNKQYEHFNAVGKTIDKCLEKLGATRLVPVGLGDDDVVIEDDFAAWMAVVWPVMEQLFSIDASSEGKSDGAVAAYRVVIHEKKSDALSEKQVGQQALERSLSRLSSRKPATGVVSGHDVHNPFRAAVVQRKELHSPLSDRSCVHVELDLDGSSLEYETGDHLGVFPENQPHVVEMAAKRLGYALDIVISLHKDTEDGQRLPNFESLPAPFPGPCTLQTALARYTDLLNAPRKTALLAMAAYAGDVEEATRLRFLASPEGKEEYASWVIGDQRSLLQVMEDFPSVNAPLGVFFGGISSMLQPRYYSISSSPHSDPGRVHVTCAVVEESTRSGRVHQGVASYWLKKTIPVSEDDVRFSSAPVFVRKSGFRLPSDMSLPIVMIGPGTGLAPFRGFLQERAYLLKSEGGINLGKAILFFGCRSCTKDYIYKLELESFLESGVLSELHLAFSRDQPEKVYVQNKMAQNASEVWNMLAAKERGGLGGHLYVCGDAKAMARDVHRTLLNIVKEREVVSASEAESIVKEMQHGGRYQRDVW